MKNALRIKLTKERHIWLCFCNFGELWAIVIALATFKDQNDCLFRFFLVESILQLGIGDWELMFHWSDCMFMMLDWKLGAYDIFILLGLWVKLLVILIGYSSVGWPY
jgi:hypothetical protein